MLRVRFIIFSAVILLSVNIYAQELNPMTKAVLKGYEKLLEEDPTDYETLYQRSSQYYQLSMYDNALNDIIKAIEYTPVKKKLVLAGEYSLMSDIYVEMKEYEKALSAIDSSLSLNSMDYANLYKKGNICLYLKKPDEAYRVFSSMHRIKSRSQEAFYGMARADIMRGKKSEAYGFIKQIEDVDPSGYITYCRIGELYEDLHEDENAAANYLSAVSLSDSNSYRPLESLISLAKRNYGAVESAIKFAVSKSNNPVSLYFIEANIAMQSGNYNQAYDCFKQLLSYNQAQTASVLNSMAKCCLALNRLSEAQNYSAMSISREAGYDNYLTRSEVERACGNPAQALLAATRALRLDGNSTQALIESALANMENRDGKAALQTLNEAVITDPTDTYATMLRAFVYFEMLDDAESAMEDYRNVASIKEDSFPSLMYKALAQTLSGKKLDGDETMKKALGDKKELAKDDYYYAAVYYAQTGDLVKGKEMIENAIKAGYQNQYNLYADTTANLSIAPLRHLLQKPN